MKRVVIPGSFDPITVGHTDIIKRACKLFDEVIVTVFDNPDKSYMFAREERLAFVREAVRKLKNVKVESFDGLLIEYVKERGADAIVRGIRNMRDFDYEMELADIYRETGGVETVMLAAGPEFAHISSSMVRELIRYKKDAQKYLPFKI